jgi:hypothetical protein
MLRSAQAEKARQEEAQARKIEAAREAEEARVRKATAEALAAVQTAIDSGDYIKLTKCLDEMEALEPAVAETIAAQIVRAEAKLADVKSSLSVAQRQELEKERIEATAVRIDKLSESAEDHYTLERELNAIAGDEVLRTAAQLQDPVARAQQIVNARRAKQNKLVAELESSLAMDDTDVSAKLRRVNKAKAALDAYVPKLQEEQFELIEHKTGKMQRRLAVLEKLRMLIAKLNNRTIAELKSFRNPDIDIVDVMRATFALLGEEEGAIETWKDIKVLIGKTGKLGLKRRIAQHRMADVDAARADYALHELLMIKDVDHIHSKSEGAAVFYAWCKGVLDEWKDEQEEVAMIAASASKPGKQKSKQKKKTMKRSKTEILL